MKAFVHSVAVLCVAGEVRLAPPPQHAAASNSGGSSGPGSTPHSEPAAAASAAPTHLGGGPQAGAGAGQTVAVDAEQLAVALARTHFGRVVAVNEVGMRGGGT